MKREHIRPIIYFMPSSDATSFQTGIDAIRRALTNMPASAGVYRMLNENGEVLYVGKAKHLKNRVSNYVNIGQMPNRLRRMVFHTRSMEIITTASEAEALLLESNMIKKFKPRYNVLLKDDKSFPYILFTGGHPFPRVVKHRGAKTAAGEYLGPFVSAGAVNETITFLQRAFLLRPCNDTYFKNRKRPCLQYQIKRCSAPCTGLISEEDYGKLARQAKAFLSGQSREIQEELAAQMQALSENMEFEKAALLRDRIKALNHVQQQQSSYAAELGDADVIALARSGAHACVQVFVFRQGRNFGNQSFFPQHTEEVEEGEILSAFLGQYYEAQALPRTIVVSHTIPECPLVSEALSLKAGHKVEILTPQRGEKKKALEQACTNAKAALIRHISAKALQEELLVGVMKLFDLPAPPERIEVYDNSHISGTNAVGGMIVAGPEGFIKKAYRKFNIKNTEIMPGDDYAMLKEVLTRRFKRLVADDWDSAERPDLVLIDGGQGQLSAAHEVCRELGICDIPLVGIAKGPDRNAGREWFFMEGKEPFQLPPNDAVLHYLQRLRDEVHRFAIGFHRDKRSKGIIKSELDSIPAIGAARKKALLLHFGSARAVSGASVEEIRGVSGINKELAQKIYDHFH